MRKDKVLLVLLIFLALGAVYTKILLTYPDKLNNYSHWILSFLLTISFYYILFIITSLIQFFIVKIMNLMSLKVFSLYPFTYDGKFRFHPILLLYNQEGFTNRLFLNLLNYVEAPNRLINKFRILLNIRKVSYLLFFIILTILFWNEIIYYFPVFIIVSISLIMMSYIKYSETWIGLDYVFRQKEDYVITYLYCCKSISLVSAMQYRDYLVKHINQLSKSSTLSLIENYLYRCLLEKSTCLDVQILGEFMTNFTSDKQIAEYDLSFDTKVLNVKKLIGVIGLKCKQDAYVQLSIHLLTDLRDDIMNYRFSSITQAGTKRLKEEIAYLKNPSEHKKMAISLTQNIFSSYDCIHNK